MSLNICSSWPISDSKFTAFRRWCPFHVVREMIPATFSRSAALPNLKTFRMPLELELVWTTWAVARHEYAVPVQQMTYSGRRPAAAAVGVVATYDGSHPTRFGGDHDGILTQHRRPDRRCRPNRHVGAAIDKSGRPDTTSCENCQLSYAARSD